MEKYNTNSEETRFEIEMVLTAINKETNPHKLQQLTEQCEGLLSSAEKEKQEVDERCGKISSATEVEHWADILAQAQLSERIGRLKYHQAVLELLTEKAARTAGYSLH